MSIFLGDQEFQGAYLGTNRLQFVYLGEDIVWQDNAAPVVSNATFNGVPLAQNSELSILRNTAHTITFNVSDLEGDAPYTAKLLRNDTQVGDSVPNIPEGGSVTFTIPQSEYGGASDVGTIDDNWDINVVDSVGSEDDFEFKVTTLDFTAPTTGLNRSGTVVGSAASISYSWNAANSTSGKDQTLTTTVNGTSSNNSGSASVSASCGGSNSVTVASTTTGGGITKTTNNSFTYSRTQTTQTLVCGSYGSCSANPPNSCTSTLQTCTANGTRTRTCQNETRRVCDNALISDSPVTQSISCSASNTNSLFVGDVSTTCFVSNIDQGSTQLCRVNLPTLPAGVSASSYSWSSSDGSIVSVPNTNANEVTVSAGAAGTATVTATVTFTGVSEGTTTRSDGAALTVNALPVFTCSNAGYSVSNGLVGEAVSASVSLGTLVSNNPSTYQSGTSTYTGTITAPASGYQNSGSNITCTDTAVGQVFELASGGAGLGVTTRTDGWVGSAVFLRWTTTVPYTNPNVFDGNFQFTVDSITNCTAPAGITLTPTVNVSSDLVFETPSLTSTSYSHTGPFNQRLRWTVTAGQDISSTPGTYRCQINMTVRPNDGGLGTIGQKAISFSVLSGRTVS